MGPDKLRLYKIKRNFSITSEPAEGGEENVEARAFVIQKHWASRLHYDLRLELNGTMKSWAVPKGPSYDPKDKRMAVHVEDHPISYNSFEGEIPPKQYGAGKVIIWDSGTWHPIGDPEQGYRDGNLKFEMRGHKIIGKWVLIRMKGRAEKQEPWLLIKEKDEHVKSALEFSVVDEYPDSVKALDQPKGRAARANAAVPAKTVTIKKTSNWSATEVVHSNAVKAALPEKLSPQLATLVNNAPTDPENWVYEIKFDGYRLLARVDGSDIKLFTRNGNDWTSKLKPLHAAIKATTSCQEPPRRSK